jgi:glycosyltransferase involved in cell wall biosynthesis
MEYMACGKTVVASGATGHADVLAPEHAVVLPPHLTAWHWDEPVIGEIVGAMEMLLGNAAQREKLGAAAGEAMKPWTWERSARTILGTVFPEEQW